MKSKPNTARRFYAKFIFKKKIKIKLKQNLKKKKNKNKLKLESEGINDSEESAKNIP